MQLLQVSVWLYSVGGTWCSNFSFCVSLLSSQSSWSCWGDSGICGAAFRERHAPLAENTNGSLYNYFLFLIFFFLRLVFLSTPTFSFSLWRARTLQHPSAVERLAQSILCADQASSSSFPSSHSPPLLFSRSFRAQRTSGPPFCTPSPASPGDMDLWFHSIRICWWRVLFLMSIFQDYLSSMLDCPPTCSCSQTEIYCNKSDNGRFFPLLALQDTGTNGTTTDIAELFKNISSM